MELIRIARELGTHLKVCVPFRSRFALFCQGNCVPFFSVPFRCYHFQPVDKPVDKSFQRSDFLISMTLAWMSSITIQPCSKDSIISATSMSAIGFPVALGLM